jgi:hypothetical protein
MVFAAIIGRQELAYNIKGPLYVYFSILSIIRTIYLFFSEFTQPQDLLTHNFGHMADNYSPPGVVLRNCTEAEFKIQNLKFFFLTTSDLLHFSVSFHDSA